MKNQQKNTTDNSDSLPIASARIIALIATVMSLGFAVVIYVFFLKAVFSGMILLIVFAMMLVMSLISTWVALKNLLPKFRCPNCGQPFFHHVSQLFSKVGRCQHCHHQG